MQLLSSVGLDQREQGGECREYPLSLGQRDVWMQAQLYPTGDVSKLSLMFSVWGPLELAIFREALQSLVDRHEILRTTFPVGVDGHPIQRVLPQFALECPVFDCSSVQAAAAQDDREAKIEAAKQHAKELQSPAFDLAAGPLLRARLLYFNAEWHCLVLSFHRLILDGLHGAQLMSELAQTYRNLKRGEALLAPPAFQYGDFAQSQGARLQEGQIEANRQFWLERLREPLPDTTLPVDFDAPAQRTSETALYTHQIPAELTTELRGLQKRHRATGIQIATAALAVLLQRTTGEREFLIAVPCSTRPRGMGTTIGFFSGILPLRIEVPAGIAAGALIESVSRQFRDAMDRREFPWTEVLNSLKNRRGRNRSLLPISVSQIGIVARRGGGEEGDLTMVGIGGYGSASSHELSLIVQEQSRLALRFSYAKDLFHPATVENWGRYMESILRGFVQHPDMAEERLPLVPAAVANEVHAAPEQRGLSVADRFLSQVERTPTATAVTCGCESLTYEALNRKANQWANWMNHQGIGPGGVVSIKPENALQTIVAVVAAVKAGASCRMLPAHSGTGALDLDQAAREAGGMPDTEPGRVETGDNGAGRLVDTEAAWKLNSGDSLLLTSATVQTGIYGIWGSLLNGARLVLALEQDWVALGQLLAKSEISVLSLTASQFALIAETMPEVLDGVRLIVVSGGPVPGRLFRRAASRLKSTRILHAYGTSDTWPWICAETVSTESPAWSLMPVGKPSNDVDLRIADAHGDPVAAGVFGQILVNGSPTGHTGRWRADGLLEYAGNCERSFVVDGIRPSLSEIESALRECGVSDAAVTVSTNSSGQRRLITYVAVADPDSFHPKDLRATLATRLPSYLLPTVYMPMRVLPRLPGGQLDEQSLPLPDLSRRENYRAPKTPQQEAMAAIWGEVLGVESVGIDDNFFELGGHSIAVTRVYQLIRERMGIEFPLIALFEHSTIASLTRHLSAADAPAQDFQSSEARAERQMQRRQQQAERRRGQFAR